MSKQDKEIRIDQTTQWLTERQVVKGDWALKLEALKLKIEQFIREIPDTDDYSSIRALIEERGKSINTCYDLEGLFKELNSDQGSKFAKLGEYAKQNNLHIVDLGSEIYQTESFTIPAQEKIVEKAQQSINACYSQLSTLEDQIRKQSELKNQKLESFGINGGENIASDILDRVQGLPALYQQIEETISATPFKKFFELYSILTTPHSETEQILPNLSTFVENGDVSLSGETDNKYSIYDSFSSEYTDKIMTSLPIEETESVDEGENGTILSETES